MKSYLPKNAPGIRSGYGTLRYAHEYWRAAQAVKLSAVGPSAPAFMLLGQSLELGFKAFLLARGVGSKEISSNPLRHDLTKLMCKAHSLKLHRLVALDVWQREVIDVMSPLHAKHEFRYILTGTMKVPQWTLISVTSKILLDGLHDFCMRERIGRTESLALIAKFGRFAEDYGS